MTHKEQETGVPGGKPERGRGARDLPGFLPEKDLLLAEAPFRLLFHPGQEFSPGFGRMESALPTQEALPGPLEGACPSRPHLRRPAPGSCHG